MTLHTISSVVAQCDGTVAAACHPHQCGATLAIPRAGWVLDALTAAGWTLVRDGDDLHHYCPVHRVVVVAAPEDDAGPCCLGSARGSDHDPDCYAQR